VVGHRLGTFKYVPSLVLAQFTRTRMRSCVRFAVATATRAPSRSLLWTSAWPISRASHRPSHGGSHQRRSRRVSSARMPPSPRAGLQPAAAGVAAPSDGIAAGAGSDAGDLLRDEHRCVNGGLTFACPKFFGVMTTTAVAASSMHGSTGPPATVADKLSGTPSVARAPAAGVVAASASSAARPCRLCAPEPSLVPLALVPLPRGSTDDPVWAPLLDVSRPAIAIATPVQKDVLAEPDGKFSELAMPAVAEVANALWAGNHPCCSPCWPDS